MRKTTEQLGAEFHAKHPKYSPLGFAKDLECAADCILWEALWSANTEAAMHQADLKARRFRDLAALIREAL